jgi:hypothetical protein
MHNIIHSILILIREFSKPKYHEAKIAVRVNEKETARLRRRR